MRMVPISAVKEGAFLAQALYNDKGQILLSKGVRLTYGLLKRIKEHSFYSIYIIDEYSQGELDDIIKPQVRQKAIATIRATLNTIGDLDDDNKNMFAKKTLEKQKEQQIGDMQKLAKMIVDDIFTQSDLMINLVDIKSMDSYTFNHSVNSAILSLVIGIGHGLNKNDLYDLTMGMLLHDVGKMFIPSDLLNKEGNLSQEEFEIIKNHTVRGFNFLKDNTDLSNKIRIISLQHHERVDGTGYPYGLKDPQIYSLSKIGAIAEVYDAITSDRPNRKALPPNEAVELVMGAGGRYFNIDIVRTFVKKVNPFPVGTAVYLSNNSIGIVEAINSLYMLRPLVRIVKQEGKIVEPFLCDLIRENNIVITGVCHEI
ncbi:HD-GYP domain-containing protein [Anaeromicrobium sediminis]|uniref:HD-GYP domain-containing protein n=1 Tax=Anaeromicrobium sediminis TaxID=1478221 RepID=A0A267MDW8_9FIRM|nr:HD-GYP domain-containing protein [Anaeromicrobium sediminis]PAB57118.1 hypothetical protein CCE28_19500 [Anaeromicrobium sediminis]